MTAPVTVTPAPAGCSCPARTGFGQIKAHLPTNRACPVNKAKEKAMQPRLGMGVHYISRTGDYECAAVISGTPASLHRGNVEAGHLPGLDDEGEHVHLAVLTPGLSGHVSAATAASHPELADPLRPNVPAGGTYQEWNIPRGYNGEPGSWHPLGECPRIL